MYEKFWAALASQGLSTFADFRRLWLRAQTGDLLAIDKLHRIGKASDFAAERMAFWAKARRGKKKPHSAKQRSSMSQWEKHREKAQESKWTPVYPGGLPSLGKKAK